MCHDRGYMVSQGDLDMTLPEWKAKWGDRPDEDQPARNVLTFMVEHSEDEANRLFVFFPHRADVRQEDVQILFEKMQEGSAKNAILVVRGKVTLQAAKSIEIMEKEKQYVMQWFLEYELEVNLTQHNMVPEHRLLSAEEKKTMQERYSLSDDQISRIQLDDPIAKYYGAKVGQVFKIVRSSQTAGRYVSYRIVY